MIEPFLRRLIAHKQRKGIIIIVTVLTGLLVVLPAADEYKAASARLETAADQLEEMQTEVSGLSRIKQTHEAKQAELAKLEQLAISESDAQQLRSDLVEMVRQTGCTMRQIRLGEGLRREWTSDDHPVRSATLAERGDETPYQLETRQLSISLTGAMANLHEFMARIHRLDKLIHTRSVSVRRADEEGDTTTMEMDLLLFDLVKKPIE
jgi:Tfp pilus assembly protein PilO